MRQTIYFGTKEDCGFIKSVIERGDYSAARDMENWQVIRINGDEDWQLVAEGLARTRCCLFASICQWHCDRRASEGGTDMKLTRCSICSEPLTDPLSVSRGTGPICAGKLTRFLAAVGSSAEEIAALALVDDSAVARSGVNTRSGRSAPRAGMTALRR